jgi:hypothetical protein
MKAEHRKELETNTLADKVGQVVKRVKTGQRRTLLMWTISIAVVSLALFFLNSWWINRKKATSDHWANLYDGSGAHIQNLAFTAPESPAGKSARLQIAWFLYWEEGVKMIGSEKGSKGALAAIAKAGEFYEALAKDCKDDPIFEPQAMLGKAMVHESLAIHNVKLLDKAAELYKEVVDKYEKSAEGTYAKDRLDHLKDARKRASLQTTYLELQREFRIDAPAPVFDPQLPDFNIPNKGPKK